MARSIASLFEEYGESHRNGTNVLIHWICVPAIFFSVIGLFACIPPDAIPVLGRMPWAKLAILLASIYYATRSPGLAIGMVLWALACLVLVTVIVLRSPWPAWTVFTAVFVLAWVGQFIGHRIEGRKPSFLKDLLFLLIGPAWLMAKVYRAAGMRY